jgi:hypothetical protein
MHESHDIQRYQKHIRQIPDMLCLKARSPRTTTQPSKEVHCYISAFGLITTPPPGDTVQYHISSVWTKHKPPVESYYVTAPGKAR